MTKQKKTTVVQHNKLIQSNYRTTLQEKRIILWVMSQIKFEDKDFKRYILKISDFAKMLGFNNNHNIYKEVEGITSKLLSKVIHIEEPDEKKLIQTSFFSSAIYKYGEGTVEFTFDPSLKPYLLALRNNYTSLSLNTVIQFTSQYAIRIYELLKQYSTIGFRIIDLKELKSYLGIPASEYQLYSSIKNRILKFAERDINNKSDINFSYIEIKNGKKVSALKFIITKNKNFVEPEHYIPQAIAVSEVINKESYTIENYLSSTLDQLINTWGISKKKAEEIISSYEDSYILNIISSVKAVGERKGFGNAAAYLIKAIEGNWSNKSLDEVVKTLNVNESENILTHAEDPKWKNTLVLLKPKLGDEAFRSWFNRVNFVKFEDQKLSLSVPTKFVAEYISTHYERKIIKSWKEANQEEDIRLNIIVRNQP